MGKPHKPQDATQRDLEQALASHAAGDLERVQSICRKLLGRSRPPAAAHHILGVTLFQLGRNAEALTHLQAAVTAEPRNLGYREMLGQAQGDLERIDEALATFQQALAIQPDHVGILVRTGTLLRRCGQAARAMQHLQAALKHDPGNVEALVGVGDIFFELGRTEPALASYDLALKQAPDHQVAHNNRAFALECQGRRDEALAGYRRVLELNPDNIFAHLRLAGLESTQPDDARLRHLEQLVAGDNLGTADRSQLHFALGRMHDRRDQVDQAFAHYVAANRLRDESRGGGFDLDAFGREVSALRRGFTGEFFAHHPATRDPAPEPVFVVGMPRSGTTLVESIIDAHGQAVGAGELTYLRAIASQLLPAGDVDPAATLTATDPALLAEAGRQYLQLLRAKGPDAARIVDKMPHNFRYLFLVPLLFSGARVIHCRRDPRDTCLSCFFTDFAQGHGYRNDLATLGHYYNLYDELMTHWHQVLPTPMLTVQYEELVADPEGGGRRIIEFLGLDWQPGCLDFPMAQRMVRTASATQVRQGVYRGSVGRWQRYEAHFQPLLAVLASTPNGPESG